jgi:hypothetical protein
VEGGARYCGDRKRDENNDAYVERLVELEDQKL